MSVESRGGGRWAHGRRENTEVEDFQSGMIAEPLLAFGGGHAHVDPKTGLALYGPYTISGQVRPSLSSIIVGAVGPSNMVADTIRWLQSCQFPLHNDGEQPFLYPEFPGFNAQHPFQCDIVVGDVWRETIDHSLREALRLPQFFERISAVIDAYVVAIEVLAQREPVPNVVLCCMPQEVVDLCTVHVTKGGEVRRRKRSAGEKRASKTAQSGQQFLFAEFDPSASIDEVPWSHENLRRGLKARCMRLGLPTQLVWPRTITRPLSNTGKAASQDVATKAWNFTTALYYKAGGTPWRLAEAESGVCFVGIAFYRELSERGHLLRTAMAQAFTSSGDGYVIRGNTFEWDPDKDGRTPHLNADSAAGLLRQVLELYRRQNRGADPRRLVIHKSSRFSEGELLGFRQASQSIPRADYLAIGNRGIQFFRSGLYPALRGTYVRFSQTNQLLYTMGYMPYLRTYPGARVPQPIEILEHHGDGAWDTNLGEILGLTKMNWNSADFAGSMPVTLAFARKVGQVLAEMPPGTKPREEFRFYM